MCRKSNRKFKKLSPLSEMAENLLSVCIHMKTNARNDRSYYELWMRNLIRVETVLCCAGVKSDVGFRGLRTRWKTFFSR